MTTQEKKETYNIISRGRYSNYVILDRKTSYCPYVVCYCFYDDDYTWGQGYYFNDKEAAYKFFFIKERDSLDEIIEQIDERPADDNVLRYLV